MYDEQRTTDASYESNVEVGRGSRPTRRTVRGRRDGAGQWLDDNGMFFR